MKFPRLSLIAASLFAGLLASSQLAAQAAPVVQQKPAQSKPAQSKPAAAPSTPAARPTIAQETMTKPAAKAPTTPNGARPAAAAATQPVAPKGPTTAAASKPAPTRPAAGKPAATTPATNAAASAANRPAPTNAPASRAARDSGQRAVSVAERGTASEVTFSREVFSYERAGRRDPFVSLLSSGDLRPIFNDLKLVAVAYDPTGRNSVAVMRDVTTKDQYRVKVGQTLGRMRVNQIQPKSVNFTIEEFGYSRQEVLALGDSTKARTP
jgi:hypothetical protein